ncbi:MAG: rod shape-determining protein MreC [Chitinophagaceae bacterium]
MRNIFAFIARFSNFFIFLVLQVTALSMLFSYNRFHHAAYMNVANEMTGKFEERFDDVETYFTLKSENEKLRQQNSILLNQLKANFSSPDTLLTDNISNSPLDTNLSTRKFQYLPAKIIYNTISAQNNYLVLHRGYNQGIRVNMAVIGAEGIIGKVVDVSDNMSVVMSLLHRKNTVVALLKKGSGFGEVLWDGHDARYITLSNIPRTVTVSKGDTVVTSPYSDIFPPGQIIGFVDEVEEEKSTSMYNLKVKIATDFYSVQHAFVVKNLQKSEMDSLLQKVKTENE